MADPTAASDTRRCPRWVKIVLAASLALNLAIAGAVVGFALRDGHNRDGRTAMGYATPYVAALPREAKRRVFRAIRSDEALPGRGARRAQYAEMTAALRADPFDRDKVQAILERQAQSVGRFQTVAQAAWLDTVMGMSEPERAAYAAKIEEVLQRGPPREERDRK